MLPAAAFFLLSAMAQAAAPAGLRAPCPPRPQPLPPAAESIGEPPLASGLITFGATPWEYPGRAWVVRLSRRGREARLEIVRLLRRHDCNLWDIEARWGAPIPPADYRSVAEAVAPWANPPAGFPVNEGVAELALDGTGLELRVSSSGGWQVTRTLNHYGRSGAQLSAIFRALVERHVPVSELPEEAWRTRRPER